MLFCVHVCKSAFAALPNISWSLLLTNLYRCSFDVCPVQCLCWWRNHSRWWCVARRYFPSHPELQILRSSDQPRIWRVWMVWSPPMIHYELSILNNVSTFPFCFPWRQKICCALLWDIGSGQQYTQSHKNSVPGCGSKLANIRMWQLQK